MTEINNSVYNIIGVSCLPRCRWTSNDSWQEIWFFLGHGSSYRKAAHDHPHGSREALGVYCDQRTRGSHGRPESGSGIDRAWVNAVFEFTSGEDTSENVNLGVWVKP